MKKVLIITYYWPPAGGSGVQRWLKFVKYFRDFNIEPIVFTVENPKYPIIDESLEKEIPCGVKILKLPIKNPQDIFTRLKKKDVNVTKTNRGGFLSWVRGNFFVPDSKLFWVKPAVKYLKKYFLENKVDLIITTGPPHSMHLIGLELKKQTNIRWISDFRDPWSSLYYNEDFNLSNFVQQKNKKLETSVLKTADTVITVSNSLKEELSSSNKKIQVVTNGFDDESKNFEKMSLDIKFSISYIGLLPKQSNPKVFWKILQEICKEKEDFYGDLEIKLIGNIHEEAISDIKDYKLSEKVISSPYIPHYKAIQLQQQAQVLLLLIPKTKKSKGILTGKLFEYLQAKRPILAIGPTNGDAAEIIKDTNSGFMIDFNDEITMKKVILEMYHQYKENNLQVKSKNTYKYHRKELTRQLSEIIKDTLAK